MIHLYKKLAVAAALVACSTFASAAVIWNQSRAAVGGTLVLGLDTALVNISEGTDAGNPNWSDVVQFATGATVTGMDIYTYVAGDTPAAREAAILALITSASAVTIRVRTTSADNDGSVQTFLSTITAADFVDSTGPEVRVRANFSGVTLAANVDYWFGMSGTGYDLGQFGTAAATSGVPGAPSGTDIDFAMANYQGTKFIEMFTGIDMFGIERFTAGDMLFRLEGELTPVPEPASLALLGLGLFGLGWSRRRKKA